MKVIIHCTKEQEAEILAKPINKEVELIFIIENFEAYAKQVGDVYFDLLDTGVDSYSIDKNELVFINGVNNTLLAANRVRINAWPGFLQRDILEIVSHEKSKVQVEKIMNTIGWKFQFVANEIGMIAPRIIAMIINEAYFGLEDGISTKEEIDIAMKLGTNYPFGPFEWAEKIGKMRILYLLEKLYKYDSRYKPSQLLIDETQNAGHQII